LVRVNARRGVYSHDLVDFERVSGTVDVLGYDAAELAAFPRIASEARGPSSTRYEIRCIIVVGCARPPLSMVINPWGAVAPKRSSKV